MDEELHNSVKSLLKSLAENIEANDGKKGLQKFLGKKPKLPERKLEYAGLISLCFFPQDTRFITVDNVDNSLLFHPAKIHNPEVRSRTNTIYQNTAREQSWSIPIHAYETWINLYNLHFLREMGFLDGFKTFKNIEQYKQDYCKSIKNLYKQGERNDLLQHWENWFNARYDSDWTEDYEKYCKNPNISEKGICVTDKGWEQVEKITLDRIVTKRLANHLESLEKIEYLDTAIRDAAIFLESEIRTVVQMIHNDPNKPLFGWRLLNIFFEIINSQYVFSERDSSIEAEFNAFFSFTRNKFAHNFEDVSLKNYRSIIYRTSELLDFVDSVKDALDERLNYAKYSLDYYLNDLH